MERDITAAPLARASTDLSGSEHLISLAHAGKVLGASPQTLWRLVERLCIADERLPSGEGHVTAFPVTALDTLRSLVAVPTPSGPFGRAGARPAGGRPEGRIARQNRARAFADRQRLQSKIAELESQALQAQTRATAAPLPGATCADPSEHAQAELTRLQHALRREETRAAKDRLTRLEVELTETRTRRKQLEEEAENAHTDVTHLRMGLTSLLGQREQLGHDLTAARAIERATGRYADRLEHEARGRRAELADLHETLAAAAARRSELKELCSTTNDRLARFDRALTGAKAHRAQVENEAAEARTATAELQATLASEQARNEQLEGELAHEKSQREQLHNASSEAVAALSAILERLNRESESATSELGEARKALAEERERREALGRELEASENVERATQRYADRLEHDVAELEAERLARRPILRSLPRIDKRSA